MSPGTLTIAMLALTLGTDPSDVVPINSRSFQIPILIKDGQRDKIKELILFSSTDQGATWNQADVATPDKKSFIFYAPNDGAYWFNITVVDAKGNREPDIYKTAPRQRVLVDTVKPNIRLVTTEWQGDEVVVGWDIQEPNPDLNTLKLEYRTADAPQWTWSTVTATPALTGRARFRPTGTGGINVRLQMSDTAGNLGTAQSEIAARVALSSPPATTAIPNSGQTMPVPTTPANQILTSAPVSSPATYPTQTTSSTWGPAGSMTSPANVNSMAQAERMPAVQPASLSQPDPRTLPDRSWATQATQLNNGYSVDPSSRFAPPAGSYGNNVLATGGQRWPTAAIVPLQRTNNPQVSLEYQVTKSGPSGVGSVELYLTEDDGRTWRPYATDPDCKPPINVRLPGEGIFGLRLVVQSKAGLGQKPPQSGDLPQMRIEVDATPPAVKLLYPQADANRRDALVVAWTANDRNLAPNPITLQWSEHQDGPWNIIAADLTNSGQYTWQLTPNLPYRVYLRVIARDTAGNMGTDQTPEQVLIDLNEPEGKLLGLTGTVRQ